MSWSIIFSGSSARSRSALMLALASWAMRPRTVCFSTMRSCLSVSAGDRCWSGLRRSEAAAPSTAAAAAAERAAHSPGPASAAGAATARTAPEATAEAAARASAAEHLVEQDAAEDERPRAPAERPARRAAADAWALLVLPAGDVGLGQLLGLHGELFGLLGYRKAGGRLGRVLGLLCQPGRLREPGARLGPDGTAPGLDEVGHRPDVRHHAGEQAGQLGARPLGLLGLRPRRRQGGVQGPLGLSQAAQQRQRVSGGTLALRGRQGRAGRVGRSPDRRVRGGEAVGVGDVGGQRRQRGVDPPTRLGEVLPGTVDGVQQLRGLADRLLGGADQPDCGASIAVDHLLPLAQAGARGVEQCRRLGDVAADGAQRGRRIGGRQLLEGRVGTGQPGGHLLDPAVGLGQHLGRARLQVPEPLELRRLRPQGRRRLLAQLEDLRQHPAALRLGLGLGVVQLLAQREGLADLLLRRRQDLAEHPARLDAELGLREAELLSGRRDGVVGGHQGGSGGFPWGWLLVLGGIGLVIWLVVRSGRKSRAADPASMPIEELNRRAGPALVAADDAVTTAGQELGFAEAQFGVEASRVFGEVLAAAKQKVGQAFTLRQQLDDSQPEPEAQRRGMLTQILQLCEESTAALRAQTAEFERLRDLQARAPEVLAETDRRVQEAAARLPSAKAILEQLAATYPEAALGTVRGNVTQASALLSAARTGLTEGQQVIGSDRGAAVRLISTAQEAVGQAAQLLDAVDRAGQDLAEAGGRIDTALASLSADVADADRLAPTDPAVRVPADAARAALTAAQSERATGDPLAVLRRLG